MADALSSTGGSSVSPYTSEHIEALRQRNQTRDARLEETRPQEAESLNPQRIQDLHGFYNRTADHIDQLRYPPSIQALKNEPYVKDGSDPQLLSILRQAIHKAPELQGTPLGEHLKAGHVGPEDIKILQRFLESKKYSVGSTGVDGLYGPRTNTALEAFLSGKPPDTEQQPDGPDRPGSQGSVSLSHDTPATAGADPPASSTASARSSGQATGAPPGYQPIRGQVPPAVTAKARSLLGGDFGTETTFESDGKHYIARVEHHYHPPGYVGGPTGWHKGVTVYEQKP
jgi:hypothetical protein